MDNKKYEWLSAVLVNDETSTDKEMKDYFIENDLTESEAEFYLKQRNEALLNPLEFELNVYEV